MVPIKDPGGGPEGRGGDRDQNGSQEAAGKIYPRKNLQVLTRHPLQFLKGYLDFPFCLSTIRKTIIFRIVGYWEKPVFPSFWGILQDSLLTDIKINQLFWHPAALIPCQEELCLPLLLLH